MNKRERVNFALPEMHQKMVVNEWKYETLKKENGSMRSLFATLHFVQLHDCMQSSPLHTAPVGDL